MLSVIQFPIADVRRFTPDAPTRLDVPDVPPKTFVNPQFVRRFGPAVDRKRGADAAWTDERSFCKADRAIRFPNLSAQHLGVDSARVSPRCEFRRLFSDGDAVVRVEIGLSHYGRPRSIGEVRISQAAALVRDTLRLPSVITESPLQSQRHLMFQGQHLARLYCRSTTFRRVPHEEVTRLERLVEAGRPLVIIDVQRRDLVRLSSKQAHVVDPKLVRGASLAFIQLAPALGSIGAWLLGPGTETTPEDLRSLRLCLLRLHAEREVLDLVLKQFQRGRITFEPGTEYSARFERYLNTATRLIAQEARYGISQSALLEAYTAIESVERSDVQASLALRYHGIRRQVWQKVKNYQESRKYTIGTFIWIGDRMGDQLTFSGTFYGTVIGKQVATTITNSLERFDRSPNADNEELKQAIVQLHAQVKDLVARMAETGAGDPEEVANQLDAFTTQASNKKPLKDVLKSTANGLVEAAKTVAEIAQPIATTVGIVLKLLGVALL